MGNNEFKFINPYNFIPFANAKTLASKSDDEEKLSGVIEYSLLTKTPLFIPNIGMNTKLWSLKYIPNAAAAVLENCRRILFIPKFITEEMDCITIDGSPTAYIAFIVSASGLRYFVSNSISLFTLRLKKIPSIAAMH